MPPITDLFTAAANVFSNDPLFTASFLAIIMLVIAIVAGLKGNSLLYLGMFFIVGLAGWKNDALGINITGFGGDPFLRIVVLFTLFMVMGLTFGILRWSGLLRG